MALKALCEFMDRPVGLDMPNPRFSWHCDTIKRNVVQVSYRIVVKKDHEQGEILWDSGIVAGNESANIAYAGKELQTAENCCYQICACFSDGTEESSETAYFSMGLMGEDKNWKALWIGGHHMGYQCYWYRKEFVLNKPVKRAVAFVASSCYYVLTVNGRKADDTLLNNVTSDYQKTLYYATYDITDKLRQEEENALGITVGLGWENLRLSEDSVGWEESSFSAEVHLKYEDGSTEWIISTLDGWYYTVQGPILKNSIYNGEIYDARKEIIGFDQPGYCMDQNWHKVVEHESPGGKLKSQHLEPIKIVKELEPSAIYPHEDGSYTIDFGQNFAGWIRLRIAGEAGTKITLQYSELEYEDHTVNTLSLRGAKARDVYYLKGSGTEVYEPSFTFHGFRYVQVYGIAKKPEKDMFTGCVIRSAVKEVGHFESSDTLLNQIYRNIMWTESSNLYGVPTDCPQRDERLGWLNDMTVRNECAIYNYRLPQLYEKWEQDIRDTQGKISGAITDTAPYRRYGCRPADPVSTSFLLVAWNVYTHYGDRKILEENYEPIKRWVNYLIRNSDDYVVRYSQMGDWAGPIGGTDIKSSGGGAISAITPTTLMATGYLYYDCILVSKMAKVLGRDEDAAEYAIIAQKVSEAFHKAYYQEKDGFYASNSQASNIFPLYLGIVPKDKKKEVLKHLIMDIEAQGKHLTTGNLCSRYAIEVLLRNGQEDLAYEILSSTEYPGWGYMVANGATTIWERWECVTEDGVQAQMASYNHPMNGAMGVSFSKHIAGIMVDEETPGFEHFIIKPVVPLKLESASFSYESVRGRISSRWHQMEKQITLKVEIPANTCADVYVPIPRNAVKVAVCIDGEEIYRDGEQKERNCVYPVKREENNVCFALGSGMYSLLCKEI